MDYHFQPNRNATWDAMKISADANNEAQIRLPDWEFQFLLKQLGLLAQQYIDEGNMEFKDGNNERANSAYALSDMVYRLGTSVATQLASQEKRKPCNGCKTAYNANRQVNDFGFSECKTHPVW